jgi:hypothetical protein
LHRKIDLALRQSHERSSIAGPRQYDQALRKERAEQCARGADLRRDGPAYNSRSAENGCDAAHNFNKDVIEKALSHEHEGIRAVYIIAEYAEQTKQMLQWWADYVDGLVNESKVIYPNFSRRA